MFSPVRRGRHVFVLTLFVALAVTLGPPVTPALASGPPKFVELNEEAVFATRAYIAAEVRPERSNGKWRGEYATSEKLLDEGKGIAAGSGTIKETQEIEDVALGVVDPAGGYTMLHHLDPDTTYYARFHAENEAHELAEKTFTFTTRPAGKPEIANFPPRFPPVLESEHTTFAIIGVAPISAQFTAEIETNGAETKYGFEYSLPEAGHAPAPGSPSWKPFTSGATGTICTGCATDDFSEDFAEPEAKLTGLTPETTYFVRLKASNENGKIVQSVYRGAAGEEYSSFTTPTARPVVGESQARNLTGTSAHLVGGVQPRGSETHWHFEYAVSQIGPWSLVPGAEGTISQAEAEALPENFDARGIEGTLIDLSPATVYYIRLIAENGAGEGESCHSEETRGPKDGQIVCEPISTATRNIASFKTEGPPTSTAFAVHALDGEALRILGAVNPENVPTNAEQTITIGGAPTGGTFTLTFKGQTTAPIAFDAYGESLHEGEPSVESALRALSDAPQVSVEGHAGGPYTVAFEGADGEVSEPQITADSSGLTPSATVTVATTEQGGEGYDTHYHFEYVAQVQFDKSGGEGGFAKAVSTPEGDLGTGKSPKFVGVDLPGLAAGETYHYRVVATSTAPANPVVAREEHTLTVPTPPPAEGPAGESAGGCPNEQFRVGPSASLPDCRAYEQVTPVDKEGAQELFTYASLVHEAGVLVGEGGEHIMVENSDVNWGSGPDAGQGPYFFSRTATGWQMTAAAAQPETGVNEVSSQVFSSDLTQFGFESRSLASEDVEFKAGSPGLPDVSIEVPRAQAGKGWVGASADLGKLILQTADHSLAPGGSTGTRAGEDLYEYSEGQLRQVNIGIGTCGANIVEADATNANANFHVVSADGSRVFFEAVPGSDCSAPKQLYVRIGGAETRDLGAYGFIDANATGTKVLLEKRSGEADELFLYDGESEPASVEPLFTIAHGPFLSSEFFEVSKDFTTIYFGSHEELPGTDAPAPVSETGPISNVADIYRYEIPTKTLRFVVQTAKPQNQKVQVSGEGRYLYFLSDRVAAVPGGAEGTREISGVDNHEQAYRYDSTEDIIQCVSCASSVDPEPQLGAFFGARGGAAGQYEDRTGEPELTLSSSNGDFVFFVTAAALIPQDVDGEVEPEGGCSLGYHCPENPSFTTSPSSDVYEWRRDGLDGCGHLQGCLALITSGLGGGQNLLLGTAEEGRDVFIYTHSQLSPTDNDTAGDIYDVRIGGGFPPPPARPTECEGDACSTPLAAPIDTTPASLSLAGAGNLVSTVTPAPKAKPKPKTKVKKKKTKKKKAKRAGARRRGKAGKSSRRSG